MEQISGKTLRQERLREGVSRSKIAQYAERSVERISQIERKLRVTPATAERYRNARCLRASIAAAVDGAA